MKRKFTFLPLLLLSISAILCCAARGQSGACQPFIRQRDTTVCAGTPLTLNLLPPPQADSVLPGVWKLLINAGALDSVLFNIKPFGFDRVNQCIYSIIHQRILKYDLKAGTVTAIPSGNWPGDFTEFVFDPANKRFLLWKAGRDNVYALPVAGGNWTQISTGFTDRDCFGASDFWNPITQRPGIYGGYGFNRVKSWVFENDVINGWQQMRTDPATDTVPKGGNVIGANADGTKLYIFSGQGNYTGDELAGSCALGSPWATPAGMYCWLRDLWQFDLGNYTYKNILPVNDQSIQYEGAVGYDFDKTRFFLFGGFQPTSDASKNQSLPNTNKTFRFRLGKDAGFVEFNGEGDVPPASPVPGKNGLTYYDSVGKRMIWARFDGIWAYYPDSTTVPRDVTSHLWSTGDTTASIIVKAVQTTVYSVKRIANGTSCTDSIRITIPNMKTALQATVNICGDTTTLDAGTGFQAYAWNTGETTQAIKVAANGTYSVNVTIGGCTAKDTSSVSFGKPVNDFTVKNQRDTICAGEADTLAVVSPQAGTTYSWYLPGNPVPVATGSSFIAKNLAQTTDYIISGTSNPPVCAAKSAISRIVVRVKLAKPVIRIDSLSATGAAFSWNAVNGALNYALSTDQGAGYTNVPATVVQQQYAGLNPNQRVTLTVVALGLYACETSDSAQFSVVTLNPFGDGIYVPNAFTPNGDGANDELKVYATAMSSMQLTIYNQWGKQLAVITDMRKGWDGRSNGTDMPAGVYAYVLKAVMQGGNEIVKNGTITLLR